jgi:hypothetical protein
MRYEPPSRITRWEARNDQRERTAYHEAGHGVAALRYGLRLRQLRLFEDGGTVLGRCEYRTAPGSAVRIVVALAGGACDERFFGLVPDSDVRNGDNLHARIAATQLSERYDVTVPNVLRAGRAVARELVEQFEPQITKLAKALIARAGVLSESEISNIVGEIEALATAPLIGRLEQKSPYSPDRRNPYHTVELGALRPSRDGSAEMRASDDEIFYRGVHARAVRSRTDRIVRTIQLGAYGASGTIECPNDDCQHEVQFTRDDGLMRFRCDGCKVGGAIRTSARRA